MTIRPLLGLEAAQDPRSAGADVSLMSATKNRGLASQGPDAPYSFVPLTAIAVGSIGSGRTGSFLGLSPLMSYRVTPLPSATAAMFPVTTKSLRHPPISPFGPMDQSVEAL